MALKAAKIFVGAVSVLVSLGIAVPVFAQNKAQAHPSEKAKKETKIDFEDELVEGELKKPELFYLLQKKQFNFKRLIKLRDDFLPEMRRDGDEVRRSRSK